MKKTTGKEKMTMTDSRIQTFALLLPAALVLAGCASDRVVTTETPMRTDVPGTYLTPEETAQVRNPETVKSYVHGPYVDPADPNVRHDSGKIDRLEQSATWNLRPTESYAVNMGPKTSVSDPAEKSNPMTAEFEQELKKQQRIMAAMAEQNQVLASTIESLTQELERAKEDRAVTQQLKGELEAMKKKQQEEEARQKEAAAKGSSWKFWQKK